MTRFCFFSLFSSLLFLESIASADWPEFRGPTRDGMAAMKNPPVEWSAEKNIAWETDLPGQGWSSPTVFRGKIYLTAAVPVKDAEQDYTLELLILDAATGKTLKRTEKFRQAGAKSPKIHRKNSHASPTPILDGEQVFVHFGHQGTACLDLQGKIVWRHREFQYRPVHGNGGSPILYEDRLIFSCDGSKEPFIAAVDRQTGKTLWKTPRSVDASRKFSFSTPQLIRIDGRPQIVTPASDGVFAYNPADGREIWRVRYDGYSLIPRPVYGGPADLLYVCTGYNTPSLLAIRPEGQGDLTDTRVRWTVKKSVPHTPSLLLIDQEIYMVSDGGIASCLDAASGEVLWKERLRGKFSASPLCAAGKLYFLNESGETTVVEAGRTFKKLAVNKLGERTLASFGVDQEAFLIRTEKRLYRVERK